MLDFEYKSSYGVEDFRRVMELLRSPEGCPWDRVQTHESIRRNMLEEAYEACDAIDRGDMANLREELGDLLMQILFHSQMEQERGGFTLDDVADEAVKKLIRRHPHIFGDVQVSGAEDVLTNWDAIKRTEHAQTTTASAMDGVARALPALWRAEKIQNKAKKVGFDWPDVSGAMDKLREEVGELQQGIDAADGENIAEELGDVLFSAVNVARFCGQDPENVLNAACDKFTRRFRFMEEEAMKKGKDLKNMQLDAMEDIYQSAREVLEGKERQ